MTKSVSDNCGTSLTAIVRSTAPWQTCGLGNINSLRKVGWCPAVYALGLLIQHIYKAIGKRMSKRMEALVARCTAEHPNNRFQRTEEVSEALLRPKRLLMKWGVGVSLLVLVVGFGVVFPNTSWGDWVVQEIEWSFSLGDSDFRVNEGLYRYNPEDSTKLSVVGGLRTKSISLHPSLMQEGKELRVTHIAPKAFYRATHLEALYIPEGIEVIEESALEYSNIVTLNLPKSVRKIEKNAFCRMYELVTLNINEGVTEIPLWMAAHNHKLQMVRLPESVLSIGMDAFAFCWAMQRINLPRHLKRIERGVFWHCKSLETITLPESLEHIGEYAFYHCNNLKTVICKSPTPPNICKSFHMPSTLTLYVPQSSMKEYQNHVEWGLMDIKPLEQNCD